MAMWGPKTQGPHDTAGLGDFVSWGGWQVTRLSIAITKHPRAAWRMKTPIIGAALAGLFASCSLASAQAPAQTDRTCAGAPSATSPTPLKDGPNSGTSNPASTGWTGGTGGSHNGTTAAGPTPGSEQYQPPVAGGLDLKMPDPPKC
jgi:hypothetical protein